ncbi:MAG: 2-phosphosulfolactate phosphatase [Armatimonadetes bacterium]|nr:2-phosphosulfolactate phosphatase [Armatimonadota bacterium]MCX7967507.1 2-phosphosulfolactate phosphatase [Armatimonadota bacterium]MDW8142464.1 2-phosphosulfolactate phosphatase [Armatimonadota bacterium]
MAEVYIAVGERGCQLANELEAIAIVVDALRASATLTSLFERGVFEVWVVAELEQAWQLKQEMPDALLIGERNSIKIEGFDFSNSPTEIWEAENLSGKRAIFTSTTGARRILGCQGASAVLVGSTVNATAVAKVAREVSGKQNRPVVIVASGVYGHGDEWATEDIAAAWAIAEKIGFTVKEAPSQPVGILDEIFATSLHGRELLALGLKEDVRWCAQVDLVSAVPQVYGFNRNSAILRTHSSKP